MMDFSTIKVLVIGDLIFDQYMFGTVERISPEAPVPILNVTDSQGRLGGAGNVAANVHSLGAQVTVLFDFGAPNNAASLSAITLMNGMNVKVFNSDKPVLSTKIKGMCGHQQVSRTDVEYTYQIDHERIIDLIQKEIHMHDLIIISDYQKGFVDTALMVYIMLMAKDKPMIALDSKRKTMYPIHNPVSLFTPNLKELTELYNFHNNFHYGTSDLNAMIQWVLDSNYSKVICVTLGDDGLIVADSTECHHIKSSHRRKVYDVSGAGDTVIAVLSLALSVGMDLKSAGELANLAGGLVVEEIGTTVINPVKLWREYHEM